MKAPRRIQITVVAMALSFGLLPVWGQELGIVQSPVLVMDSEEVFGTSVIGQQITTNLEEKVAQLAAENRRIAAELEAEELALTEQRITMEPLEFRDLADQFDAKVQRIRDEQDAKQRELQRLRDVERQSFVESIGPILSGIAREFGAVVVLERRNVLLSADSIDITRKAIARIDAALAASTNDDQLISPVIPDAENGDAADN